jgi:hypothetical protein
MIRKRPAPALDAGWKPVFRKIMPNQRDWIVMRFLLIAS